MFKAVRSSSPRICRWTQIQHLLQRDMAVARQHPQHRYPWEARDCPGLAGSQGFGGQMDVC